MANNRNSIFVEHLKKWEGMPAIRDYRLFSCNADDRVIKPDGDLLSRIKADANKFLSAFKEKTIDNFLIKLADEITLDLSQDTSWQKGKLFAEKIQSEGIEKVKAEILSSYLFRVQSYIFTDIKEFGLKSQLEDMNVLQQQEFKSMDLKNYFQIYMGSKSHHKHGRASLFDMQDLDVTLTNKH